LTALQQVEDNLEALRILEQEAQQQQDATASAQESIADFRADRYIGGADPYLQVLTAQTIALQNERNDVDILRRRMDASVQLIKVLGWRVERITIAEGSITSESRCSELTGDEFHRQLADSSRSRCRSPHERGVDFDQRQSEPVAGGHSCAIASEEVDETRPGWNKAGNRTQ